MSGTRYTEVIALEGALAMAPGETRIVDNPILRDPDVLFMNHQSGDATLEVLAHSNASITLRNNGSMTNETRIGVVYRHSVPK